MFNPDAMRELVRVNRKFIREEAIAKGDMATVAEMDEIDAREQRGLRETPEAKAHAYIRSLERAVETERVRAVSLAAQLAEYRTRLVEHQGKLSELVAQTTACGDSETSKHLSSRYDQTGYILARLDEITGKGE